MLIIFTIIAILLIVVDIALVVYVKDTDNVMVKAYAWINLLFCVWSLLLVW